MKATRHNWAATRRGLTLTELLVVLVIILVLAGLAVPVVQTLNRGRKVAEASSQVQSQLVVARDRAKRDSTAVGVLFTTEPGQADQARTLQLIRQSTPLAQGSVFLLRERTGGGGGPDPAPWWDGSTAISDTQADPTLPVRLVIGDPAADFSPLSQAPNDVGVIRFEEAGPLYVYRYLGTWNDGTNDLYCLRLVDGTDPNSGNIPSTGLPTKPTYVTEPPGGFAIDAGIDYKVQRPFELYPNSEPVILPEGTAIDLGAVAQPDGTAYLPGSTPLMSGTGASLRMSRISVTGTSLPQWYLMFSPSGGLLPPQVALPIVGLWVREVTDDTSETTILASGQKAVRADTSDDDHSIVAVQPTTGYVSVHDPVLEDIDGDGYFDPDFTRPDNTRGSYYDDVLSGSEAGY